MLNMLLKLVESKTRTNYRPVGSGRRTAGRRGGAGLDRTGRRRVDLAKRQPSALQRIEDNCPERLFGSTNKRNPM